MIEELSQGEYLTKAVETPKVWRSTYEDKSIIEFEAWVSTETIDRDGEILRMSGWRKASLRKPKLLLFHDYYALAIGSPYWTKQKEEDGKKGLFTRGRMGPQLNGLAVGELYLQGDMDAFSVGFNWFKRVFDSEAEGVKKPFYEYIDQELYEYSAVNIPANPEAIIAMLNDAGDVKDAMAIIKGLKVPQNNPIKRDSYIIKDQSELKDLIKQTIIETIKNQKHLNIDESDLYDIEIGDDDNIDLDVIEVEVDASENGGDASGNAEVSVEVGDDAGIEVEI